MLLDTLNSPYFTHNYIKDLTFGLASYSTIDHHGMASFQKFKTQVLSEFLIFDLKFSIKFSRPWYIVLFEKKGVPIFIIEKKPKRILY
ncbi:hypothetical protein BpHYR1_009792 [Brachionus plicatilis]|uniref:Uncharacterized protein n=1 Tax=Brachionus plicatilis TaxID=10195 RepID=A0A3M7P293_BRAPC|nr:hypothetical protein BpHYR1_009792 [Brachionus plicatilis]